MRLPKQKLEWETRHEPIFTSFIHQAFERAVVCACLIEQPFGTSPRSGGTLNAHQWAIAGHGRQCARRWFHQNLVGRARWGSRPHQNEQQSSGGQWQNRETQRGREQKRRRVGGGRYLGEWIVHTSGRQKLQSRTGIASARQLDGQWNHPGGEHHQSLGTRCQQLPLFWIAFERRRQRRGVEQCFRQQTDASQTPCGVFDFRQRQHHRRWSGFGGRKSGEMGRTARQTWHGVARQFCHRAASDWNQPRIRRSLEKARHQRCQKSGDHAFDCGLFWRWRRFETRFERVESGVIFGHRRWQLLGASDWKLGGGGGFERQKSD